MPYYVYKVLNSIGEYYYGSRTAKGVNSYEADFFKKYFTSSKWVQSQIKQFGAHSLICEKVFEHDDPELVILVEQTIIRKYIGDILCKNRAVQSDNFYIFDQELKRQRQIRKNFIDFIKKIRRGDVDKKKPGTRVKYLELLEGRNLRRVKELLLSVYENGPDRIFITNHFKNGKRCPPPPSEAKKEKLAKAHKGKVLIHKDGNHLMIKPDKLEYYESEGWVRGHTQISKQKITEASTGRLHNEKTKSLMQEIAKKRIYFTSPDLTQVVSVFDVSLAPEGWLRGNKLKTRSEKIAQYGRKHSKDRMAGRIWFNNGVEQSLIFPSDVPEGWHLGRLSFGVWCTNCNSEKRFPEESIPIGWFRGRKNGSICNGKK